MSVKSAAKSTLLMLPKIGPALRERDRLFIERNALVKQQEDFVRDIVTLTNERNEVATERDNLVSERRDVLAAYWAPPGHFYSPVADLSDVRRRREDIFNFERRTYPGIDLHEDAQLQLLDELEESYAEIPFSAEPKPNLRYHFDNPAFSYADGILFYSLLRKLRPKRLIEIGSGYSSALALDTNELFLDNSMETTFIEPFPELVRSLLRPDDQNRCRILDVPVQDVAMSVFEELGEGDILFIDSTHVSKVGSDVNYLYFEVLPLLRPGVFVHIHDVFLGFEYPEDWIFQGRAWNEQYLLRAFLMENVRFDIVMMNSFMQHFHEQWFKDHMPLCLTDRGQSIWLQSK